MNRRNQLATIVHERGIVLEVQVGVGFQDVEFLDTLQRLTHLLLETVILQLFDERVQVRPVSTWVVVSVDGDHLGQVVQLEERLGIGLRQVVRMLLKPEARRGTQLSYAGWNSVVAELFLIDFCRSFNNGVTDTTVDDR
uniref:(northern house mosquito) hypothetical protein n=1 Tax=Culex pipiens TaxID=7175 RepID=A0A8D8D609_CULPI